MEGNTKTLLVVDDEIFIREIYKDLFQTNGIVVDEATDGMAAFELMNRKSYGVILLDIMMPGMDGITLLSKLKDTPPSFAQGPILLTTNLEPSNLDSLQKLYSKYGDDPTALGVVAHIVKADIEPEELLEKVTAAFSIAK